ncbi:MAG: hypothetical protein HYY06_25795 [Deltaproteobacteria bacterium]|nr:hypothetical protein [Deltaproteobacteria bacterium]
MSSARLLPLLLFCLGATGCGARPMSVAAPAHAIRADEFDAVRRAWTRSASVVPLSGFENVLTVTATFQSLEFRAAYVARYARDYGMGPRERADLAAAHRSAYGRELTFYVTAYSGTQHRDADLSDPDRGWRVLLLTPHGRYAPTRIEKIENPTAVQRAYYPHTHPQRMVFLIGFPPALAADERWFGLDVRGARGSATLRWQLDAPD